MKGTPELVVRWAPGYRRRRRVVPQPSRSVSGSAGARRRGHRIRGPDDGLLQVHDRAGLLTAGEADPVGERADQLDAPSALGAELSLTVAEAVSIKPAAGVDDLDDAVVVVDRDRHVVLLLDADMLENVGAGLGQRHLDVAGAVGVGSEGDQGVPADPPGHGDADLVARQRKPERDLHVAPPTCSGPGAD